MGLVRSIATLLFIISVPVALVTANVRILANEGRLYEYAFDQYNAPRRSGIARDELVRASQELRTYFNNDDETVYVRVQEGGREVSLFNPKETAHLRDVKNLFTLVFRVQEFSLIYALVYVVGVFVWAREGTLRALAGQTMTAAVIILGVIVGLGVFAFAGFDQAFEQFHLISFDNEFWKLNPRTDHLIQMFPEDFWFDASIFAGIMTLLESALLVVGCLLYLSVTRRQEVQRLEPSHQGA